MRNDTSAHGLLASIDPDPSQCGSYDESATTRRQFLKGALGCMAVPALASPMWVICGCGGGEQVVPPTPRLASVDNFRDVTGASDATAYQTASGQRLRRGLVYRSNVLTPTPTDLAVLDTLDILSIYDLRTPGEITTQPDTPPFGAMDININIMGTPNTPTPNLTSADEAVLYMKTMYAQFVNDGAVCAKFAQVFEKLASAAVGSQLYHCSEGKDRTGWTTVILLSILGVPQNAIDQDYMLTNIDAAESIQASYEALAQADGQAIADIYKPILVADQSYLDAAYAQVAATYQTMTNYINDGLGLSANLQAMVRARLLG
ncbi:MAG: tyrosine-protein phosphatase [Acidobacteriaceae bacterium]